MHSPGEVEYSKIRIVMLHVLKSLLLGAVMLLVGCHSPGRPPARHEPTPLPIDLFALDDSIRQHILAMHEEDTSAYLIDTRPVLFQIQGVGDDQSQHRGPVTFDRPVRIMIYALGEERHGVLCDYGWIEDASGIGIWRMNLSSTVHAGGAARNRKTVDHIDLPAGSYTLRYVSNEAHSAGGWIGAPPERPHYYGITAFNLAAIERIKAETTLGNN